MASKVDVYLRLLDLNKTAPKDDKQVKSYVDNLLEGLGEDIKARVSDKDLANKIADEIKLRF